MNNNVANMFAGNGYDLSFLDAAKSESSHNNKASIQSAKKLTDKDDAAASGIDFLDTVDSMPIIDELTLSADDEANADRQNSRHGRVMVRNYIKCERICYGNPLSTS